MDSARAAGGHDLGALGSIRAAAGSPGALGALMIFLLAMSGPSLSGFMSTIVSPLGSSIAQHFGGGEDGAIIAQLALTLPGAGVIIGGPLAAWLLGSLGYRKIIVISAVILTVGGAAGAFLDDITVFLASRLLVGLATAMLYTVLISLCGMIYSGKSLARMLSYQNGASAAVGMVLVLGSGWVAHQFGWRSSFLLYLIGAIYVLVPLFVWLPEPIRVDKHTDQPRGSLKPLMPLLIITVLTFIVVYLVTVQGSLLLSANGVNDPSVQSLVIAASTLTFAVVATACTWIETHWTGRYTFTWALLLMGIGAAILGAFPQVPAAVVGSLIIGAGSGLTSTYLFRAVVERATADTRDRAVGLIGPAHYLGFLANPILIQSMKVAMSIQYAFVVVGGVLVVSAVFAAMHGQRQPKPSLAH